MNKRKTVSPIILFLCVLISVGFISCSHKEDTILPAVTAVAQADVAFNRGGLSWDDYLDTVSPYFTAAYDTEDHMGRCWESPPVDLRSLSEDERQQLADANLTPKVELGISKVYDDTIPDQKIVLARLIVYFADLPDQAQQCNQRFHLTKEDGAWKITGVDVYWAVSAEYPGEIPPEESQKYNKVDNKIVEYTWTTIE